MSVSRATSFRSAAASSPNFFSRALQALDVVEQQLLLGGQHLDVGVNRGRIVAPEPASECVCGFGFHRQFPFLEMLVALVNDP